ENEYHCNAYDSSYNLAYDEPPPFVERRFGRLRGRRDLLRMVDESTPIVTPKSCGVRLTSKRFDPAGMTCSRPVGHLELSLSFSRRRWLEKGECSLYAQGLADARTLRGSRLRGSGKARERGMFLETKRIEEANNERNVSGQARRELRNPNANLVGAKIAQKGDCLRAWLLFQAFCVFAALPSWREMNGVYGSPNGRWEPEGVHTWCTESATVMLRGLRQKQFTLLKLASDGLSPYGSTPFERLKIDGIIVKSTTPICLSPCSLSSGPWIGAPDAP
ncbi:6195_t:CDS:2, partial [Acaulospora colombiana]